jgi:hypothetical protein
LPISTRRKACPTKDKMKTNLKLLSWSSNRSKKDTQVYRIRIRDLPKEELGAKVENHPKNKSSL